MPFLHALPLYNSLTPLTPLLAPYAAIFEKLAQELEGILKDIANNQTIKIAKGQMIEKNRFHQLVAMLPHKKHPLC